MWTSAHIRFLEETLFSSVRRCLCPCRWWQNAISVCYSDAIADFHKIFMESQLCWLCPETSQSLCAISEGVTLMQLVTGHLLKYSGLDAHDVQQWRYFHSLEEKRKSENVMICFDLACFLFCSPWHIISFEIPVFLCRYFPLKCSFELSILHFNVFTNFR